MATPVTLSGFNNIDFKSIVDIIIKSERQPITRLEAQQKTEQTRLAAYNSLNGNLSNLNSALANLKSASAYGTLKAASSDSTTLTATATSSASKGTFTIDVISLARPQVTASTARQFDDINAAVIDSGSFSVTQNGTTTNIDLTGVTSLSELRIAINAQQSGITAAIINDGSSADSPAKPFRLVLTSATPGVANAFTVDDQTSAGGGAAGSVLNLTTDATQGVGRDTELTYNGITIKSTSTSVAGAVPGLTLNLLKTGTTIVSVTDEDGAAKDKIKSLVTAFNSFNDFVDGQFKLGGLTAERPPLATDSLLRGLNRQIRGYLTSNHANSGTIDNVTDLGITFTQTGKLDINETTLDQALASNREGVETFLSGASGFSAKISNYIGTHTQAGASLDSVEARIQATISRYSNRIGVLETQLVLREDVLIRQFAAADRAISQLNSQANALSGLGSQYRLF